MPTTCFDNKVWDDLRYRALPPALRAAFGPMISRIQQYGDATLTDRELRVDLLGPKRMAALVDSLIAWGWLTRAQNGNLSRAGLLVPISADALRMRALRHARRADDFSTANAVEPQSEPSPIKGEGTVRVNPQAAQPEQIPNTIRTPIEQAALAPSIRTSDSEPNQIRSGPHIYVESDPIRSAAPTEIPKNKAFDKLLVEGVDPRVLAEAARRMANRRPPIEPWKERYLRATVKSIIAERQQSLPMVTIISSGPTSPDRASPPMQLPEEKPAFLTRRLANGGTIL